MADQTLIQTQNLAAWLGNKQILYGIDFSLSAQELVAIIGPNGAGKTTLLRTLAGLVRKTTGMLQTGDKRTLAYLAQGEELPHDFTASEIVSLGRLPHQGLLGQMSSADDAAIKRALLFTQTLEFRDRRIATLSGGERQRVALARALAQEPKVLLLDEPTNHLDVRHQAELLAQLRQLSNKQEFSRTLGTVVVVHDLNLAAHADRIVLLESGRVLAQGKPREVLEPELLERAFGIRFRRITADETGQLMLVAEF